MNQKSDKLNSNLQPSPKKQITIPTSSEVQIDENITTRMVKKINKLTGGLNEYKTRDLVEDSEELGRELAKKLKTTQIRKFLDTVNRLKAQLADKGFTEEIKSEIILLRPKLAYAAARQPGSMDSLQQVLEAAIKKIEYLDDFNRFVQLIESIIAYHKASGGREQ
ncbi:type III-A CRISPR-associated protein Csm2 [Dendronalium sp. ChiSLP03b]|uniref:type III-A CRISPR-associated protein Csm2 n=1 Tax=Dendronalium sp. ChiSLP03b TaxID=3075381 RepID=UPI002AD2C18E|nr:type III-A CRISPR-associated protein Csm2 [Dendronalium sp. ChiSLP03b]MDZ8206756.1 type III-A CRISPR-associated protein Csm2 [Dendronalium sp. ChiSLP03b]